MSLSVCLLTRNEEHNMARVLRSVEGLADQVIVADTGSIDRTVALAREHGALIKQFDWSEDFAAGRNFALGQATGDWILWLNPDEELLPDSQAVVRQCLERADALAYAVVVQELVQPVQLSYHTETVQIRLFRRHPQVRYTGRVHPEFVHPFAELSRRENKQVFSSAVTIRHHAYLSVPTEGKLRWAAHLLALEVADHPDQLSALINYGKTLLMLNDPKGHAVLARAVEQILPLRNDPSPPLPQVQMLLEYLLTVSPRHSQSRLSRQEAWELAQRWFPGSPPMLWTKAAQLFQEGDFRQAAQLLTRLVEFGQTGHYDKNLAFNPSIIGDDALMNLGACYTKLRELDRAESCFRPLLGSPTLHAKAREYLAMVQGLREDASSA
jgi:hypothetical protein